MKQTLTALVIGLILATAAYIAIFGQIPIIGTHVR